MQVGIVGLGNMGQAFLRGLQASPLWQKKQLTIVGVEKDKKRCTSLAAQYQVEVTTDPGAVLEADCICLCIKPMALKPIGAKLSGKVSPQTVVASIIAGVKMEDLSRLFAHRGPVVRSMPNIAATVGESATALCANQKLPSQQMKMVQTLFDCIGKVVWVEESLMDVVTGLSGSGPAYLYMVIEAMTDGGVKMGMPRNLALQLATQTVVGAAHLVEKTGEHPAVLRDQVTTPGGTTIHAIAELESHGLRSMLINAVVTATLHSRALGRTILQDQQP